MSDLPFDPNAVAVAVLLFEDVELLDFAGPYETLAVAGRPDGPLRFKVRSVGIGADTVRSRCGPRLIADERESDLLRVPPAIVIVPGGFGVRALLDDASTIQLLRTLHAGGTIVASVCTGAWLLAKAGLLDGHYATTHHLGFERLVGLAPRCIPKPDMRVVDAGTVITSAGVSAGIDLGIALVRRWWGDALADATAGYIEWSSTAREA